MHNNKHSKHTPLYALHLHAGGRFVDFAGYQLPIHYEAGILAEHRKTRQSASLFDVAHMGQARIEAEAKALEKIFPADLIGLGQGQMRYSFLLNEQGGIMDDLMIIRYGARDFHIIVNAACRAKDFDYLKARVELTVLEDRALLALQGPAAMAIIAKQDHMLADLPFMAACEARLFGVSLLISRSGYTGEDGYEISVASDQVEFLAKKLLADQRVQLAGLGARDTLRLEAGLCLYGQDIDETISPIEARLGWAIGRRRKQEGGFPGAVHIAEQLRDGVARTRTGFLIEGRRPVRRNALVLDEAGQPIGHITSGGVAADCPTPIAMGYIQTDKAVARSKLWADQSGRKTPIQITKLPFRPHRYFRKNLTEVANG